MNEHAKQILLLIEQYMTENPQQRFTQALSNLRITEFAANETHVLKRQQLRDFYYDTDGEVLERIKEQLRK